MVDYYKGYDETDPISIENYAKRLVGKTFSDVCKEDDILKAKVVQETGDYEAKHENKKRKGGLGELIEERYFHYQANNDARPDFEKAGVELKVTPYKINMRGDAAAKERLVLTMIDYMNVVNESFEDSHMWAKARLILLIYYLYRSDIKNRLDYKIDYVKLFTPPEDDLRIIENDFKVIVDKIRAGKAHELSEGDTLYLGAATKAATSSDRREQPFSNELAKPRAFSFKTSYMTYVLNKYIIANVDTYEPIIKDKDELKHKTFEELIVEKIKQYVGKTDRELCDIFGITYTGNKAQWNTLAYRMLGIKSNQAEEFVKAQIVVKTIRLEESGTLRENSPLPAFSFKELVQEEWEESSLFCYFDETRFFFVVFQKQGKESVLKGCQFWNMPYEDLNNDVQRGWEQVRETVRNGVEFIKVEQKNGIIIKNNLLKKTENPIIHVRPHTQQTFYVFEDGEVFGKGTISDSDELPDGRRMTKQSFWLNSDYIVSQLNNELK